MPVYRLTARVDDRRTEMFSFNPLVALSRVLHAFPEAEKLGGDHLEDTCVGIAEMAASSGKGTGAVRIALKDLVDRGPALRFRIPRDDGGYYEGIADRQR